MKVIGLTGLAGAGKSVTARYLCDTYGYVRLRFADPLKAMLRTLGLNEDQVDGSEKEVPCNLLCGKTPRWAMQTLGTEWGRALIGEDLWVNAWLRQTADLRTRHSIVADDVRYPNEVAAIYKLGGIVAHIERPNSPIDIGRQHASEAHDLDYDVHIINDSYAELFRAIDFRLIRGEAVPCPDVSQYVSDRVFDGVRPLPPKREAVR